ncbi:hypothetical protein [Leptotrichia hofstadii]|uniref:Esterase Ig-like N-terminal domain-containing protein n=1 Tax=Leptotrichia hofstadii F0254 TaxID=634994 RepID=C9MWZ0_9FUSO|nr:hypothetical protein [Leptotrichia hofstadii]EEX75006.1 hypothetical protein GCWU000323_01061 [Leptotrichia hofstadii F0254]
MIKNIVIGLLGIASLSFAGNIKKCGSDNRSVRRWREIISTYDKEIAGNPVFVSDYKVEGREIEKVYVSKQNERNEKKSKNGKYVILELKRLPMVAQASDHSKEEMEKKKATGQKAPIMGEKGDAKPLKQLQQK